MLDIDDHKREDLLETLVDLKHDLGKHIKLPVTMTPKDAGNELLTEAVIRAVENTRSGPGGPVSAAALFERFAREWAASLSSVDAYRQLAAAVDDAVLLAGRARNQDSLSRDHVIAVLSRVGDRVVDLLEEVERG